MNPGTASPPTVIFQHCFHHHRPSHLKLFAIIALCLRSLHFATTKSSTPLSPTAIAIISDSSSTYFPSPTELSNLTQFSSSESTSDQADSFSNLTPPPTPNPPQLYLTASPTLTPDPISVFLPSPHHLPHYFISGGSFAIWLLRDTSTPTPTLVCLPLATFNTQYHIWFVTGGSPRQISTTGENPCKKIS